MTPQTQFHYVFCKEKPRPFAEDVAIHRTTTLLGNHAVNGAVTSVHPFWGIDVAETDLRAWRYRAKPGRAVLKPEPTNPIVDGWGGPWSGITFLDNPDDFDYRPEYGADGWYMVVVKIEL